MSSIEHLQGDEAIRAVVECENRGISDSFYQSSHWIRVWNSVPRFTSYVLVRTHDREAAYFPFCVRRIGLIRQVYSMPLGTYGGVVGSEPDPYRRELTSEFCRSRAVRSASLINVTAYAGNAFESARGFCTHERRTHILDLGEEIERIHEGFSENHRRNLAKLPLGRFELSEVEEPLDVKAYCRLVTESDVRHNSTSGLNEGFFRSLLELLPRSVIRWQLVLLDGSPCCGHLYFIWKNTATYWHGCSDQSGLEFGANFHLFWENIRRFKKEGLEKINFGSGPEEAESLKRFKKGWGARDLTYTEYVRTSRVYRMLSLLNRYVNR